MVHEIGDSGREDVMASMIAIVATVASVKHFYSATYGLATSVGNDCCWKTSQVKLVLGELSWHSTSKTFADSLHFPFNGMVLSQNAAGCFDEDRSHTCFVSLF